MSTSEEEYYTTIKKPQVDDDFDLHYQLKQVQDYAGHLRNKLEFERYLLKKEKLETSVLESYLPKEQAITSRASSSYSLSNTSSWPYYQNQEENVQFQPVNKKNLKAIESQCDRELMKLNDYLKKLKLVKNYWKKQTNTSTKKVNKNIDGVVSAHRFDDICKYFDNIPTEKTKVLSKYSKYFDDVAKVKQKVAEKYSDESTEVKNPQKISVVRSVYNNNHFYSQLGD